MADRKLTVRIDLKPGDLREVKTAVESLSVKSLKEAVGPPSTTPAASTLPAAKGQEGGADWKGILDVASGFKPLLGLLGPLAPILSELPPLYSSLHGALASSGGKENKGATGAPPAVAAAAPPTGVVAASNPSFPIPLPVLVQNWPAAAPAPGGSHLSALQSAGGSKPPGLPPAELKLPGGGMGGEAVAGEAAGIGEAAAGASSAAGPIGLAIAAGLGIALKSVELLSDTAKKLYNTMLSLAAAANPAGAERLERAYADLNAVLGRSFVPVLDLSTDAVRLFADLMASVMPPASEVSAALSPLKDILADLKEEAQDLAPAFRDLLQTVVAGIGLLLKELAEALHFLHTVQTVVLGYDAPGVKRNNALQSSFGAAPAEARYSSIEEYGRENQRKAYSGGTTTMPGDVTTIRTKMESIYEVMVLMSSKLDWLNPAQKEADIAQDLTYRGGKKLEETFPGTQRIIGGPFNAS